jgi:uncharacterized protein YjiK
MDDTLAMRFLKRQYRLVLFAALAVAGCKTGGQPGAAGDSWPRYVLETGQTWQLNLPEGERFDASALVFEPNGDLLTLSDQSPGIYRIVFHPGAKNADLERLPECFTAEQMAPFTGEKIGHYDCEGLAEDSQGRLYVSEESNRWILRFDRAKRTMERLDIDFTPVKKYFDPSDLNASFEGVAVNGGTLYVANERKKGRLITVDLATLKVTDDFCPRPGNQPFFDVHFSDLCWSKDSLYALLREDWVVLKLNPATHAILAEYNYQKVEDERSVAYHKIYPFVGVMEGLAVDDHYFWMVTDNNGLARVSARGDTRPTLFKCPRPDL